MKILLICLDFYDYTKTLIKELQSKGNEVTFYDARPYVQFSEAKKALYKLSPGYRKHTLKKYAKHIAEEIKDVCFDVVLCISINTFNNAQLKTILNTQKEARKIYYMWDSLTNFPNMKNHFLLFDEIYSYDLKDVRDYNLNYLPMFVSRNIDLINNENITPTSDVTFIAVTHPHRYTIINKFKSHCASHNISFLPYLYTRSNLTLLYLKLTNKEMRKAQKEEFKFKQLSDLEKTRLLASSRATLDICYGTQYGVAQRVVEALMLKRKVLTRDKNIVNYPFFNNDNIFISNKEDFSDVPKSFFVEPFKEYKQETFVEHNVSFFVKTILK